MRRSRYLDQGVGLSVLLLLFAGRPAPTLVSAFQRRSLRLFPHLQFVVFVDGIFKLRALFYHLNALCLFHLLFFLLFLGGQDGSSRDGLLFLQKLLVLEGTMVVLALDLSS
jgi:hypothetical protein